MVSSDKFDIDKLRAMMDLVKTMPPPAFFGSWRLLAADNALKFKFEGRDYLGAHPDFWAKVKERTDVSIVYATHLSSLDGVEIIDLDVNKQKRAEFVEAMTKAMQGSFAPSTIP